MSKEQFREKVFELETVTPELKESFRKEIRNIVEKPLKPWERILAVLLIPIGIGIAIFGGRLWFLAGPEYSRLIRSEIGIASVIGALLAIWSILVVKKRRHLRNNLLVPAIAFGMFVAMIALSVAMTGNVDIDLLAATMVVGFACVWDRVKIAELRIRENILRQELRLAEFIERFGNGGSD